MIDGERPEQQGGAGRARDHIPQADGAGETALGIDRGEGKTGRRQPAIAQVFRSLAAAAAAKGVVEERLALGVSDSSSGRMVTIVGLHGLRDCGGMVQMT
jgi:hypothetical protein